MKTSRTSRFERISFALAHVIRDTKRVRVSLCFSPSSTIPAIAPCTLFAVAPFFLPFLSPKRFVLISRRDSFAASLSTLSIDACPRDRANETFVPLSVEITKREQSNIFGRRNTKRRPVAIVSIIGGTVCTSVTYRERARGIGQRRCKANMRVQRTAVIYEALEDCILSSRSPGGSRLSTGAIHGPSGNIFMGGATPAAAKPNWMRLFFVLQSAVAGISHGSRAGLSSIPAFLSRLQCVRIIGRIRFDAR